MTAAQQLERGLTLGVEEEYLLVDPDTGAAASNPPRGFFKACKDKLGKRVTPEFLRCQIEIASDICHTAADVRAQLHELRGVLADTAAQFDLALMAASTHPFAPWEQQKATRGARYAQLSKDMAGAIHRMMICGMHVHVGLEEPAHRIEVMNQMRYFLPHMLALSASSPFWNGQRMGMHAYRLSVFDGMPRTGMPETMTSWGEYTGLIDTLVQAGVIEDSSKVWWDIRPSHKFPTLEMRVCDVCTRVEDAVAVAALYQCLTRRILRLATQNMKWRLYPAFLIEENRWLAQRRGVQGELIDFGTGEAVGYAQLAEELTALLAEDADALSCTDELAHIRTIVERGTSAQRQIATYEARIEAGDDHGAALRAVVLELIRDTVADIR